MKHMIKIVGIFSLIVLILMIFELTACQNSNFLKSDEKTTKIYTVEIRYIDRTIDTLVVSSSREPIFTSEGTVYTFDKKDKAQVLVAFVKRFKILEIK